MIDLNELGAWLRLLETPLFGRASARKALAAFGSPDAVLRASPQALREVLDAQKAARLSQRDPNFEDLVARTRAWLDDHARGPRSVIPLGDPRYPDALLETADPPLMLYAQGRVELLGQPAVAIVGSRNPTPQGVENAREFARALGRSGLTVVSGLALGIDAAAHEGALDSPASTIAVVATGLDIVYPRRHLGLARRIAQEGLMLSEYAIGTPSLSANFPRRNRIIAGLARGTLVVEAAVKSGSLITARLANEAGREVFAIPGSIHAPQARGCHALIKQGAKLVETAEDVLEELQMPAATGAVRGEQGATEAADTPPLLAALGHDPVSLDALAARTGWSAAELHIGLLTLELEGKVMRLPGQLFQRTGRPRSDPGGV